jgi:hypothetical protein
MNQEACELCGRVTKQGNTQHHLIPRTLHSNKWFKRRFTRDEMQRTISVCRDCHRAIHRLIPDEKELGRHYPTKSALRDHPGLSRFLTWIRRQK